MPYTHIVVPKGGYNPGRVKPKDPNIILFRWDDVEGDVARDDVGVTVAGDIVFKTGQNAITIYATPTTIKASEETTGDPDKKGFISHLEFEHPGDNLTFDEWCENNVNANLGAVIKQLDTGEKKLLGTKGSPLQFNVEMEDSSEHVTNVIKLASLLAGPKMAHYTGADPSIVPAV